MTHKILLKIADIIALTSLLSHIILYIIEMFLKVLDIFVSI